MIKINLLPQRKQKRARGGGGPTRAASTGDAGQTQFLLGVAALLGVGVLVFFLVHKPMLDEKNELEDTTARIQGENKDKKDALKNYETTKAGLEASKVRGASIEKLVQAKAVPANLLHELGEILTLGHNPTMTSEMTAKVSDGPRGDPNKRFQIDWDPKHVWITSFVEKDGAFTLKGGAQSDPDVTQLAKRMQASVYFMDVTPKGGLQITDRDTNLQYYEFTITGKVVY
jgi:type IV pilus assembly protein PilN